MSAFEPHDTLVEALRRANPVPAERVAGRLSQPSAHALFAEIVAQPLPRPRRSRSRKRALVIAIVVIVIALLVAAFVVVRREPATNVSAVACYSAPRLDAPKIITRPGRDLAAACAALWTDGSFAALGVKSSVPNNFDVCVLAEQVPAVFPGESGSVCARLGLSASSGSDTKVSDAADRMDRRIGTDCIGYDAAVRIVKDELASHALGGWTIRRAPSPYDAAHPCASLYVDAEHREITVIPYPGAFPPPPAPTGSRAGE